VADVEDADTREEVEEDVSVDVADRRPHSFLKCDRNASRVGDRVAVDLALGLKQFLRSRSWNLVNIWFLC
jgi:hypothetical protein